MVCQECKERPATLHVTKVINGEKSEVHICEQCAQEKGNMSMFTGGSGFSLNNLIAGLLNSEQVISNKKPEEFKENKVLQCERCKMTFAQFTKIGRFGCSECYRTFEDKMQPILKRFHSGNTMHAGKIPKRIGGSMHVRKEIDTLKEELKELILQEEFESAANIRDKIRELEKKLSDKREEEQ
ncbi:UvrB/UvrC motif-containing protein [Bacillus tianshenii]|uniref:UvrB/UvrC motif-containing protein n=1 Tax=Sutcliffiella tianshenii TaxID=1463404 RepID=UPI001CD60378|nr:UvrB/UvrC motif-containing protein [Bacillus tianshenii]MCA1321942.1 UvrB/UvrC motif-containing protein [Bacillus tianshenii]